MIQQRGNRTKQETKRLSHREGAKDAKEEISLVFLCVLRAFAVEILSYLPRFSL
jgi:hypothetical protein